MNRTLFALFASFAVSFSVDAFAQDAEEVDAESGRKIKYKERTEIDFEGVDVQGELVKPSGTLLMDVKRSQFNPLIRFRTTFDKEMKESLDEVK